MTENPFSFRADPIAKRLRLVREARQLIAWGEDGQVHQPVFSSMEGHLGKLYLCLTFACPLRCPFCQADGGTRTSKELAPERILAITREAVALGFREIVVTGGEPLVYSGIVPLMREWSRMEKGNTRFILRTSFGFPLPEDRIRMITRAFDEITVSIDGDEQRHDAIRGSGVYRQAVAHIRSCLKEGTANVNLASVMEREELEGAPGQAVDGLRKQLGIEKWVVRSPLPLGRGDCEKNRNRPSFEWRTSDDLLPDRLEPRFSCGFGKNVYMEPDGRCYPCYVWCREEDLLGDLSEEDLTGIVGGDRLLACMNCGVDTNKKCSSCSVRYLCGGVCKLFYRDREDVDCGDFDCCEKKEKLLEMLSHLDEIEQRLKDHSVERN